MIRAILAWLLIVLQVLPVSSATYYVRQDGSDSNTGTENTAGGAWATMTKAAATMVAGDTTLVQDGEFVEASVRFDTNNGSSGSPITLKAQNQHLAVLSSTSGCQPNIYIDKSYVVIDGLRSSINAANVPCAGGHNSTDGDAVRAFATNVPTLGGTETTIAHHTIVKNMLIDASSARSHSLKIDGDGSLIENNIAYNGIETGFGSDITVRWNRILGADGFGNGLILGKFGSRNVVGYGNYVECTNTFQGCIILGGSAGNGFHFDESTDIEGYNILAYGNLVVQIGSPTHPQIVYQGCKDCGYLHNTFVGSNLEIAFYAGGANSNYLSSNPVFKNNSLASSVNCLYSTDYTGTFTTDYNNFRNCTSPPAQTHNVSGDPALDANYVQQAGSVLIDAAETITTWPKYGGGTIALDFSAKPGWFAGNWPARPVGAGYDVGAFEYTAPSSGIGRGSKGMGLF